MGENIAMYYLLVRSAVEPRLHHLTQSMQGAHCVSFMECGLLDYLGFRLGFPFFLEGEGGGGEEKGGIHVFASKY